MNIRSFKNANGLIILLSALAIVQMNQNGRNLWKFLDGDEVQVLIGTLRCILAPLLLILIIAIVMITVRAIPKEPIPRF